MAKKLNEYQFIEIMANVHVVQQALPTAVSDGIQDAVDRFIEGQPKSELDRLDDAIMARVTELAKVHLQTASRQFRGARNVDDD
jgi:hypothetical protein